MKKEKERKERRRRERREKREITTITKEKKFKSKLLSAMMEKNESVVLELQALSELSKIWKCEYTYIGGDVFSRIDGIFTRDNVIKAIFDVKVRKQSLSWYEDYKSIMINFNKIQVASEVSRLLKVKFFHIVKTSDNTLLVFEITKEDGTIVCPMNVRYSDGKKQKKEETGKQSAVAYLPLENNDYLSKFKIKGIGN